jgi:amino acid transporter
MRRFFFTQKVMFTIAVVGTLIFIGTLLATSRADFTATFNQHMGDRLGVGDDAYNGVIAAAREAGWSDPGFDWKQTLLFSNWAFLPLIGAAFSISIGGEIKQVSRAQTIGILGAIVGAVTVWLISFALIYRTMGSDFLGAVTYSNLNAVEGAATPVTPFPTLLTGLGAGSIFLTALIALGFIGWIWLWIPTQILYPTRAIVAWSLDRVAPDVLGSVNERTHTPIPAIVLSLAGGITFVGLLTQTTYFNLVIFIEVAVLAWSIVLLAGVFFPYRRPDIYEKSPIANVRIGGIPVMSIACAFGCAAAGLYFANLWFDGFAAGHARHSLSVLIGWWVGSFLIYWIMWFIRRRQGIKVELAFREIPIE